MRTFTVSGRFQAREGRHPFSKSVEATNESVAEEHVLSQLGSEHGLKRTQIEIEEVQAS